LPDGVVATRRKLDYNEAENYKYTEAGFIKKLGQIDRALGP
jgi:hypothetical protein